MCKNLTSTPAVLIAAPYPVGKPQPSKQTLSKGALSSTLHNEISATTVYSEKVEVPMKCQTVWPLQVNLEVPSGITPFP